MSKLLMTMEVICKLVIIGVELIIFIIHINIKLSILKWYWTYQFRKRLRKYGVEGEFLEELTFIYKEIFDKLVKNITSTWRIYGR